MKECADDIQNFDAPPNPEYLIKSIAEQGYSLETSLADLIDNSISAGADKVEVLVDMETEPFVLFLADNGEGMSEKVLQDSMRFPSESPDHKRKLKDLGRFGLGMKTASFSQTRRLTVLSRLRGEHDFRGRTWDVGYLRDHGWKVIINSPEEVNFLLERYRNLTNTLLGQMPEFEPNTIVIWQGLYKYEDYLEVENRVVALKKEITDVTAEHLSLVFHRYMEKSENSLKIRVNNQILKPFNPFPNDTRLRALETIQRQFDSAVITVEGFVLPSKSLKESDEANNKWTTRNLGLSDLEGIYIYRNDRIIFFGGWNGIIKKSLKLQLARLRMDVNNSIDHLLHLNVAKSKIVIPFELRQAFENYVHDLKNDAEREYLNRVNEKFRGGSKPEVTSIFKRTPSSKGILLEVNEDFPVLKVLIDSLDEEQAARLNLLLRMLNNRINEIRKSFDEKDFIGIEEKDGVNKEHLIACINQLLNSGYTKENIKNSLLPNLGFKENTLPEGVLNLLN